MADESNKGLIFRIFKGDELLREETLHLSVVKIGKLSSSHLRLEDESVSRMHAVIEVGGDHEASIIDLGSTTGTVVNGEKVNKAKLASGDTITLGDIRIEFSFDNSVSSETTGGLSNDTADGAEVFRHETLDGVNAPSGVAPPPGVAAPVMSSSTSSSSGHSNYSSTSASSRPIPQFGSESSGELGARSIEIAAMLGDSVVNVKHLDNPKSGKVQSATYALWAIGGLLLILAVGTFFKGVQTADWNKRALHKWVEVDRQPVHQFRPKRLGMFHDWLAIGGSLGGLFCLTLGYIRLKNEKQSPFYRIGQSADVDLPTTLAGVDSFALVAPSGDDFVFNFMEDWDGDLKSDGELIPLSKLRDDGRASSSVAEAGAMQAAIPNNGRFRVQAGGQAFLISSVVKPKRHPVPFLANLDTKFIAFLAGSTIAVLGFIALIFAVPPKAVTFVWENMDADGRLADMTNTPDEDEITEEEEKDGDDEESGGTGEKMALDEGAMGKKESTKAAGQFAMKNNDADPQLAKQQAIDAAQNAGILGTISAQQGGAFASLTGAADFSSGLDDRDVYGGLLGNEVGEMAGGWGYGVTGVGPGGGGTGWGTIGQGGYGKIGHGSGTGDGYGTGSGRGSGKSRKSTPPQVKLANATVNGDLDANIIRRYIRRKLPRIRNCYEKELVVKPNLSGTVTTQFRISPKGVVQGASAKGMGNTNVEKCVAGAIGSIQFPEPKGGGSVNVRYPFTFQPSGG